MSGVRHADLHRLHLPGDTPVHRIAPEAKLVGLVLFAVAVAVTPRTWTAVFLIDATVLAGVIGIARLPLRVVAARLTVILPFVAFAALVPVVGSGPRVDVWWFSLSSDGLWAAWAIVAKAALGAAASIVVAATTPLPGLVDGLTRLHLPRVVVAIIAFMFRYLGVLIDQLGRMRRAMTARGHDPRWLWQVRPIASSVGVLFVRSYERGERVQQAMTARGWTGVMPQLDHRRARAGDWIAATVPAAIAGAALILATAR